MPARLTCAQTMNIIRYTARLPFIVLHLTASAAGAQEVELGSLLPSAMQQTAQVVSDFDVYQAPIAPFVDGTLSTIEVSGPTIKTSWTSKNTAVTTDQLVQPLIASLQEMDYEVLFDCTTQSCGGFDFRYAIETLPPPALFINLSDFRFAALQKNQTYLTILASRLGETLSLQIIDAQQGEISDLSYDKEAEATSVMPTSSSLSESLEQKGYAILEALEFTKGSAELRAGAHTSLAELSNFLKANPDQKIVLVGHTDNSGSLENNLKLSKQRAQSVLDRLIKNYGIESDRLSAEGVGFLSPQTSNKGQKGREINRRVEVILSN